MEERYVAAFMGGSLASSAGEALAKAYAMYSAAALLAVPAHFILLGVLAWRVVKGKPPSAWRHQAVDVVYGLANPFLYLLVFDRMVAGRWPSPLLSGLGAAVLIAFWGFRCLVKPVAVWRASERAGRALLLICIGTVAAFFVRDLMSEDWVLVAVCAPLYWIPIASAIAHLQAIHDSAQRCGNFLFASSRATRAMAVFGSGGRPRVRLRSSLASLRA